MGEINLNSHTIVDELVGIIGMLHRRDGSTLKDIMSVLESLHGPVRQDVIQDGLEVGVLSGVLECSNRRYKVCKQKRRDSLFGEAGCSSWGIDMQGDTDSNDDLSVSSLSTLANMGGESSRSPSECYSIQEILSVKSIKSSNQFYASSNPHDESEPKEKKRKEKRRLIVKLPMCKKSPAAVNDTENSVERIDESFRENGENMQTQELPKSITKDDRCLDKNQDLPIKRSMTDVINQVMIQFSEQQPVQENKPSCKDKKESVTNEDLSKAMTEIMKKVNGDMSGSGSKINPETSGRDGEDSGNIVKSLGGVITKVMKRITGGNDTMVSEDTDNTECADVKNGSRNVGTEPRVASPGCSKNEPPISAKRKKRRQESDSMEVVRHQYLTRSRAKTNQLTRSRVQSPSHSDVSSKKPKLV